MPSRAPLRVLAVATLLSDTGSAIAAIAVAYSIYERTGSALWLAGTLFFTFGVTGLLSPIAGRIADRRDRRRVMIASDVSALACWSVLAFVHVPLAIASIGFIASLVHLPFGLAASAAVPNLVEESDLDWANARLAAASSIARLAGPALGGGIYAVGGAGTAFAVNAVSFALSAILVLFLRGSRFAEEGRPDEERASALEGFRVIRRDAQLLWLTVAWTAMWLAMNIAYVADPPLAKQFGVGAFGFGLIDTSFGVGALVGSVVASRLIGGARRRWTIAGMLGVAAGWATIALTPWFALVLVGSAIAAGLDSVGTIAGYGIVQRAASDAVRARVFAAQLTAGLSANMLGFVIVGPLVQALGPRTVYGLGGIVSVIAALSFALPTSRRRVERVGVASVRS